MLTKVKEVYRENLLNEVAPMLPQGYRFVTLTCVDCGEYHEIMYHFDKNYELTTLKLKLYKGQKLPSISDIIFAAIIVENEIHDLFGIKVKGLALDYEGRLLLTEDAPKSPFNKPVIKTPTI